MRIIFVHTEEHHAHSVALSDLIAEALMQKIRLEVMLDDACQGEKGRSV